MILHRPPGSEPHSPELVSRSRTLIWVVAIAMLGLVGRLWQLQVVRGESYYQRARFNVVKERSLPAVRGRIFDSRKRVLADSRPAFDILIDPSMTEPQQVDEIIELLELDLSQARKVRRRLDAARARGTHEAVLVLKRRDREQAALARQISYRFPGISVDNRSVREYPNGREVAHLLGYLNEPNLIELRRLTSEGYRLGDVIGRFGLERRYESYLRGKRGVERFLVNARGQRVEDERAAELIDGDPLTPSVPGHDLFLSINLDGQRAATKALAEHAAAAVAVVEVNTGRVLVLVSKPGFDPNAMSRGLPAGRLAELLADPRRPLIDKTMREHYPPGSTFKLVTAIAALKKGLLEPTDRFTCTGSIEVGGRTFHCNGVHGNIDLATAIQRSCNVYFWRVAERTGLDAIADIAVSLGFGEVSGLGLNSEVPGRIPTSDYYQKRDGFRMGDALNAAVGQGDVAVTVLQLANAYATIANGGRLYTPTVVDRIVSASGTVVMQTRPLLRKTLEISAKTKAVIAQGMDAVVNKPGGTAYRHARGGTVRIAGKTGTAQVRARQEVRQIFDGWHPHQAHGWFAGVAPSAHPTIAFAVLIEHGGSGGTNAGPVARAVVEALLGEPSTREPMRSP